MENKCCICTDLHKGRLYRRILSYNLLRCSKCKLVYIEKIYVKDDEFIEMAKNDASLLEKEKVEFWSFPELYNKYEYIFRGFFRERLDYLNSFHSNIKSLFDVGCGYGFWMKYCQEKNIVVSGLDNSQEVIQWAENEYKLDVDFIPFEKYDFKAKYDAITICDVLEHVVDPNFCLVKLKQGLKPNGILCIQVPNLIGFKLPFGHGFGLPFHIWQFSIKTLKTLLEKNGFEVLGCRTGVMGVVGAYEHGGPSLSKRLIWFCARKFYLGNRLVMIAKPIDS